jgi:hypothetical protein
MDREQYEKEMNQISKTSLGLEMTKHVTTCKQCFDLLNDAQLKVIRHLQEPD